METVIEKKMNPTTAKPNVFAKTFPGLPVINNPSEAELRGFAKGEEVTTEYDAPAYVTKLVSSRSAGATFTIEEKTKAGRFQKAADPALAADAVSIVQGAMKGVTWMQFDRRIGQGKASFHCRLLIPKELARVALLWGQTLFPASAADRDPAKAPDFLTVYFPHFKDAVPAEQKGRFSDRMILIAPDSGITYVLGVDYVGECKMSFLRLGMFRMKQQGGLGLHAGSKIIRVKDGKKTREVGFLLFGLSGTGKTTLTLEDHGLKAPEAAVTLQDDIVLIDPKGHAYGTENNFYVKTEGLTEKDQPALYGSLMSPECVLENVTVDANSGKPDFLDSRHGTNGRALALRARLPHTTESVDLPKTHKLIFITRRDTVVPPVARLTREQAVAFFMLGESIETSAGDPKKAGQPKHEVGFSPFIIGLEDAEGNRLFEILKKNPDIEAYVLNTGSVGKGGDAPGAPATGVKITKAVSAKILEFLARPESAQGWKKDPDWGYEVLAELPGVKDFAKFEPSQYYAPATYKRLTEDLKKERRAYLAQFTQLDPKASSSI